MMRKKFFSWLNNTKAINLFEIETLLVFIIGVANSIINRHQLSAGIREAVGSGHFSFLITAVALLFNAIVSQLAAVLVLSLVAYFAVAAMGKPTDIKKTCSLSIRSSFFLFSMTFTDLIGFLTIKSRFISIGTIGILGYTPFYISVYCLTYSVVGEHLSLSKNQRTALAIICAIFSVFATYPL